MGMGKGCEDSKQAGSQLQGSSDYIQWPPNRGIINHCPKTSVGSDDGPLLFQEQLLH